MKNGKLKNEGGKRRFNRRKNEEELQESGGESEIRTHGRIQSFNGFQDRRFKPLSHLSKTKRNYCRVQKALQEESYKNLLIEIKDSKKLYF